MKRRKLFLLTVEQFVFLIYLLGNTSIFFIALSQGDEGVTVRLFGGGDDGYFYWEQAKKVAAGEPWIRTSIYPLIIGYLIKITGIESVYLIRLFNYLGFILLVILAMRLIKSQVLLDEKIYCRCTYSSKILILITFLFYASLQMNVNLSIYRDIWIYTLYAASIYLSIELLFYKNNRLTYIAVFIFTLWLLGEFRTYALLSFVLSLLAYLAYKKIAIFRNVGTVILVAVVIFGAYFTFFIDTALPIVNISLRDALNYRTFVSTGGSQMGINLDQPNFILFLLNYIHSYVGNLVGPLPWHIRGLSTLFVFTVETIPMIFILGFIWRKRYLLSAAQKYILSHAFVWISLIAVSNDNLGAATRLRPVAWILILTVFVVVYSKNKYIKNVAGKYEKACLASD